MADEARKKIVELLPKLRPSGVTVDQPWCIVPAMPYWPSGASGPIKLFLYPNCLGIIEQGRAREYTKNVKNHAEFYQAMRYSSDDPKRRENLWSVENENRTIVIRRTVSLKEYHYTCLISYGTPAATLSADETSRLTWEAIEMVNCHSNLNENVLYGLQFGPPTRVVPADRVVAEGQVGPPGQTDTDDQLEFIKAWLKLATPKFKACTSMCTSYTIDTTGMPPPDNSDNLYAPPVNRLMERMVEEAVEYPNRLAKDAFESTKPTVLEPRR